MIREVILPDADGCVDMGTICPFLYHDENFEPCCSCYKKRLSYHGHEVPQKLQVCKEEL